MRAATLICSGPLARPVPDETGDDPELAAIRRRLLEQLGGRSEPAAAPPAAAEGKVLELTDATFDAAVRAHPALVVDCWAVWCGPCRIVEPIVKELARELAGKVTFGKLDVDANPRVAQAYAIQSIPTLLFFANGAYADRAVGAYPKPQLAAAIRQVYRIRGDGGREPGVRRM